MGKSHIGYGGRDRRAESQSSQIDPHKEITNNGAVVLIRDKGNTAYYAFLNPDLTDSHRIPAFAKAVEAGGEKDDKAEPQEYRLPTGNGTSHGIAVTRGFIDRLGDRAIRINDLQQVSRDEAAKGLRVAFDAQTKERKARDGRD